MSFLQTLLSRAAESIASACATTYLFCATRRTDVRYRVACDPQTFAQIGNLRRGIYRTARSAYLLDELDAQGLDAHDRNATSFVAQTRDAAGEVFATVRAVRYPFEVLQFVREDFLAASMGGGNPQRTVEVSRLVNARPSRAVTNGLILFGGVYLVLHGITRYFAYVAVADRPVHRPVPGHFMIPHRNPNGYSIIAGSIATHAARVGPLIWRKARARPQPVVVQGSELS